MEPSRAALLAAKMSGAWPARGVSDTTVALWAERFTNYPEDVAIRVSAKAMANLKEPPSSSELRDLLRNDSQTELASNVVALPRPTGVRCDSCDEPMVLDSDGELVHEYVRHIKPTDYVDSDFHKQHDPEASCFHCTMARHPSARAIAEQVTE